MVICKVTLTRILGVWHGHGFVSIVRLIPNYLLALPLQLLLVGPAARALFRAVFRRGETA